MHNSAKQYRKTSINKETNHNNKNYSKGNNVNTEINKLSNSKGNKVDTKKRPNSIEHNMNTKKIHYKNITYVNRHNKHYHTSIVLFKRDVLYDGHNNNNKIQKKEDGLLKKAPKQYNIPREYYMSGIYMKPNKKKQNIVYRYRCKYY